MDAVVISNNAFRMSSAFQTLKSHFFVTIVPPYRNNSVIDQYATLYKRDGDDSYGAPHKQISLTFSHLTIWRNAQTYTKNKFLYIFEDDVDIEQNFSACSMHHMEDLAPPMFFLGTCAPKNYGAVQTTCKRKIFSCSSLCTHAYAIRVNSSNRFADAVLQWAHTRAMHGHSLYRYNLDVKLRGYIDAMKPRNVMCSQLASQKHWNSTSGHSKKCCAW